jgi:hypothetical protein
MTDNVKVNVTRIGVIVGVIVAFVVLLSAVKSAGDERYVTRPEYLRDVGDIKSDIRAMRCEIVKDCGRSR